MHARKNLHLILASQIYKEVTSYPRYQWASQVFPKIIVMVVGLQHVWLIRDIYFNNRKSPGFTKGCRSSHWVKSNFPQGNCERLDIIAVLLIVIITTRTEHFKVK